MIQARKGRRLLVVGCFLLMVLGLTANVHKENTLPSLTPERIQQLREYYPVYNYDPPNYAFRPISYQEIIERSETVIVAESIGELPEYETDLFGKLGIPEQKVNEKITSKVIQPIHSKNTQFEVKILESISGKPIEGTIRLVYSSDFRGYEPALKPGMKIVTGIAQGETLQGDKYYFSKHGTYYIVDNDYVLSAVDDDFSKYMNGGTVHSLIQKIKILHGK
ncbi:hypothetical protein NQ117_22150 [Paenibacillus sp. SC116]|uniref:hypothetical protein n=1 Tax=Paenibacillus sp. SC116 TaxID=2968986 RepID=UPI00215B3678|nr:hypothetical protein [Paenibacillus sp. SC116]MCR8846392.1 hypothetical protein [Paenibacillus sp. SC116]